ncbi:MAG: cytochrome c [Gammaproteobacteria bacterium]|nr:cytochrome c [Gammaproteobacteria bacterium]MDH5803275.1 cytochrome c [Gammaproteobacteria bacterium]
MKKFSLVFAAAMLPSVVFAWPWSTDMMNQPSIKPQEGQMRPFPKRSVPVMGIPTKVKNRDEAETLANPIAVGEASLKKGRTLFRIYCAACHGLTGKGDAPAGVLLGAADLTQDYIQQYSDGRLWGTITFGSVIMPAYGVVTEEGGSNDLSVEERWHVVNYLKNALRQEK